MDAGLVAFHAPDIITVIGIVQKVGLVVQQISRNKTKPVAARWYCVIIK